MMSDLVSSELREIEKEIDSFYQNNALVTMSFGEASWLVMAAFEDLSFNIISSGQYTPSQMSAAADNIVVYLQHPILWLWNSCSKGGTPSKSYNDFRYEEASKLTQLAQNYDQFYVAFTYASNGWTELRCDDNFLIADNPFLAYISHFKN